MTRIITALADISADYDVLFCDLWGCLHNGQRPYPAAVAALEAFRAEGGKVVLMTNAPRPAPYVEAQLDLMGVPRGAWDVIASSGDAAQEAMYRGDIPGPVWHCGPEKDLGFFDPPVDGGPAPEIERVAPEEAASIVCTGLFDDRTEGPEDYRARLEPLAAKGAPLLCANPDIVVDVGEQRIYCAGAIAEFYESLGGRSLYYGKPHAPIYDLAKRRLGLDDRARILAIGDGIHTDVAGAKAQGIDAIFVTGGLAASQFGDDVENPDPARLEAWLDGQNLAPRFAIGRLR
ncbi:MAG: TIGR01459 family HAD-type hydrolase [Paracoccus sp. (in: a-proteobacteria)]|nr:TIGR01459 family HAD-type hydrolase [Paracoccus sp. (in: a-proteobacteria)]